jgi:hypothetical protein
MPLSLDEIRALCTKEELALVLSSHSPAIEKFSPAEIKTYVLNTRKHVDKWQKLSRGQARTESRKTGAPDHDSRSHAKHTLFKETLAVYEARLAVLDTIPTVASSAGRKTPAVIRNQKTRVTRQTTRKELHRTKKKINSAAAKVAPTVPAVAAAPATTTKKVATKKKAKPSTKSATKKGTKKAVAAKQVLAKTAAVRAAKRVIIAPDAVPSTAVKPATKTVAAKKVAPGTTPSQKTKIAGKAKANRVAISNRSTNIAGHVSAKGKRSQARRDSKSR